MFSACEAYTRTVRYGYTQVPTNFGSLGFTPVHFGAQGAGTSADVTGMDGRPHPDATTTGDAYAAVAAALWTEREALEQALFKMEEERLVILSGSSRWLHKADSEVQAALADLHTAEVLRAIEVDALEDALGAEVRMTLAELAETAPAPWPALLAEHRALLRDLVREVEAVARTNRKLLQVGVASHAVASRPGSATERDD